MLVYNSSTKDWSGTVFGNWHSLKSGQIKNFNDNVARFLSSERRDHGLMGLPEAFEEPDHKNTPEGKAQLAEAKTHGTMNRIKYLRSCIYNESVSLKKDLEVAGYKIDPSLLASPMLVEFYEELKGYANKEDDEAKDRAERIKKLASEIKDK